MIRWQQLFLRIQQHDRQSEYEEQVQQYFLQVMSSLDEEIDLEATIEQKLRKMKELPQQATTEEDASLVDSEEISELSEGKSELQVEDISLTLTDIKKVVFRWYQFPRYEDFGLKTNRNDTLFVKRRMIQPLKQFIAFRTAMFITPMYSEQAKTTFEFILSTTFYEKQMNKLFKFSAEERIEIIKNLFCIEKPPRKNQKAIALSLNDLAQPFDIQAGKERLRFFIQNGKFPNRYQKQTIFLIFQAYE